MIKTDQYYIKYIINIHLTIIYIRILMYLNKSLALYVVGNPQCIILERYSHFSIQVNLVTFTICHMQAKFC